MTDARPKSPAVTAEMQQRANAALVKVIGQAKALGIPVARRIAPQVSINTRAKKRFGCCRGSAAAGFTIEAAAAVAAADEAALCQTLAHEVLHTCPGCQNHGEKWKAHATAMNSAYGYAIRRTGDPAALGVSLPQKTPHYRWCLVCTGCGRRIYRQKASALVQKPQRYRCSGCGGRLRLLTLDPNTDPATLPMPF